MAAPVLEIDTPYGPARVHLHAAHVQPVGALILGHGANGGVGPATWYARPTWQWRWDYVTALVEQPYKVAGKRSPAPATQLDTAWRRWSRPARRRARRAAGDCRRAIVGRARGLPDGGRTRRRPAVLCLAFPLHPPGKPDKTRQPELDAVRVPTLIVQGESDPFGLPRPRP